MKNKNLKDMLKKAQRVSLTKDEKHLLWQAMQKRINAEEEARKYSASEPFYLSIFYSLTFYLRMKKTFVIKIAAIVLIFSSTVATAFAANDAKPGDILFGIDRAIENIQLALTTDDENEARLKLEFAAERLEEVRQIIEESQTASSSAETATSTDNGEDNSGKTDNIEFALSFALNFMGEMKNDFVDAGNDEGAQAMDTILDQLNDNFNDLPSDISFKLDLDQNKSRVQFEIGSDDGSDDNIRIKVKSNGGKVKIETRDDNEQLKIEIKKDGRIKIKTRDIKSGSFSNDDNSEDNSSQDDNSDDNSNQNDDDSSDDNSDDNSTDDNSDDNSVDDNSSSSQSSQNDDDKMKITAKVRDGITEVEVEINGDRDEFELTATDRESVIAAIASQYGIPTITVDAIIRFD